MHSRCARFVLRGNGELYNHRELRGEQQAAWKAFRGTSGTEVTAEGFSIWGVQATVKRLIGMFAIAVFNRADVSLHLIRDRLGIKKDFDEDTQPTGVADHLGTDHFGLDVEPAHGCEIIPEIPCCYDAPAAASQMPTLLLPERTRRHVTDALSGDDRDEVLAGYNRYLAWQQHWPWIRRWPQPMRCAAVSILRRVPDARRDDLSHALPPRRRPLQLGDEGRKSRDLWHEYGVRAFSANAAFNYIASDAMLNWAEVCGGSTDTLLGSKELPCMQLIGTSTYHPDGVLTKAHQARIAASLAARLPLMDHWVLCYIWWIMSSRRVRTGQCDWTLRNFLYRDPPVDLLDRPKTGHSLLLRLWRAGSLRQQANNFLAQQTVSASNSKGYRPYFSAYMNRKLKIEKICTATLNAQSSVSGYLR